MPEPRSVPEEDVVDLLADVGPETQKFPVDAVQDGLQVLPLPGVLAVKQLQELHVQMTGQSMEEKLKHLKLPLLEAQLRTSITSELA